MIKLLLKIFRITSYNVCYTKLLRMLVKIGLSKLNENRLEEKLSETKEQSIQLKDILDFSPVV